MFMSSVLNLPSVDLLSCSAQEMSVFFSLTNLQCYRKRIVLAEALFELQKFEYVVLMH